MRFFFYLLLLSAFVTADAQVATGVYNFGSFDNKGFDTINRANLNTHFSVPAYAKQGRGGFGLYYNLTFDSAIWTPYNNGSTTVWQPATGWGWTVDTDAVTGYFSYTTGQKKCFDNPPSWDWQIVSTNFLYVDNMGTSHAFAGTTSGCSTYGSPNIDVQATDGSGFTLSAGVNTFTIQDTSGKQITPPVNATGGVGSAVDRNGNKITTSASAIVDTTGSTALTITGSGTSSSPRVLTYPVWESSTSSVTSASVTINYTNYNVMTAFGCSNVTEYSGTANLPTSIVLADGETYTFSYEPTPGHAGSVTGRLSSATLPTGGIITYGYSGGSNGIVCADGGTATLTRTESSSAGTPTWTYSRTPGSTQATTHTDITDGMTPANHSSFDFVANPGADPTSKYYETNRLIYQGAASGTPLVSAQTCYNGTTGSCTTQVLTLPVTAIAKTTTLDGVSTKKVVDSYSTAGLITEEDIYNFGSSAPGSLLRKTTTSYANGLPGFPSNVLTSDSAGNTVSQNTYGYDETTPTATSGLPNHVPANGTRGNLTTSSQLINSGASITATATYDDAGTLLTSTSPNGKTTYGYDSTDTFVTSTTMPTPASGVQMTTTASNDVASGVLISTTGPNAGQTTQVTQYDNMLRPYIVLLPNTGQIAYTRTGYNQTGVHQTTGIGPTDTETLYDGYGRTSRVVVANGASSNPWYQTDYCYNSVGQLQFQSTQYAGNGLSAPKQCSGAGDTYSYDALGRVTNIAHADGSADSKKYTGRAVLNSSSSGASRIVQSDGLGRTTAICEISSNASMPGSGAPTSCGLDIAGTGFITTYAYDLANHKTTITQGSQTRVFQTDDIGRTTLVQEPESGQTTYSYAYNSTGLVVTRVRPQANQTNPNVLTTTTTQYDTLGRVLSISYSDGTQTKSFTYDQATNWGPSGLGASKGRLTLEMAGSTGMQFAYDLMGNVTNTIQCLPDWCGIPAHDVSQTYGYNLAGWVTSEQYSNAEMSAVTLNYGYNLASQLTSMTGGQNNAINAPTIFSVQSAGPSGPLLAQFGNGLHANYQYDSEGRLDGAWVCATSTLPWCNNAGGQLYGFGINLFGKNVVYSADTALNRQSFLDYDEFGRLSSVTPNQGQNALNMNFTYDRYGNRWSQSASNGPNPNLNVNVANNQVTSNTYDAVGNITQDSAHSYQYDAENNIITVDHGTTATYTYDALNQRVKVVANGITERYGFDIAGRRSTIWQDNGTNLAMAQYYAGSRPVAYWSASDGNIHFQHQDWMGTERVRTSFNGSFESAFTSLPFGDALASSGADTNQNHFAMLDHDTETLTEHATFRQYSSTQGRWFSPDPYSGSYHRNNPQSFNRYVYARNNPLSFVDPMGLDPNCYTGEIGGEIGCEGDDPDPDPTPDPGNPGSSDPNNPGFCDGPNCTSVGGGVPYDSGDDPYVEYDGFMSSVASETGYGRPSSANPNVNTPAQCAAAANIAAADDFRAATTMPKARNIVGRGIVAGILGRILTNSNPWAAVVTAAGAFADNIGGAIVGEAKFAAAYNSCMADSLGANSWAVSPFTGH